MSPSGLHLNKPLIFVIIFGVLVGLVFWMRYSGGSAPVKLELPDGNKAGWKMPAWVEVPQQARDTLEKVNVQHVKDKKITVGDTAVTIAYREVKPAGSKLDVLLLHGAAFKSQTWADKPMFTLQLLHGLGYHAVAIDLPGHGDSPDSSVDPAAFLETVVKELQLTAPVIISPSMSGKFSLPYLFKDAANVVSRARGFVPVAPVNTAKYTQADYQKLKVPTLIVYGSKDTSLGLESEKNLRQLPQHVVDKIEGGSHPCYLDAPDTFHSHLLTFLQSLQH